MYQLEDREIIRSEKFKLDEEDKAKIRKTIEKIGFLGKTKAPGWDLINQNILRNKTPPMNQFLTNCLIECLEKNRIPPTLSCSRLIPFNKCPGKTPTKSEIRNIATQPLIIQLFETLVIRKFKSICNYNHEVVDSKVQKGFLQNSST